MQLESSVSCIRQTATGSPQEAGIVQYSFGMYQLAPVEPRQVMVVE